tara:strand:+ start:2657 stop:3823 length:1167 start_codon:yes stop_codon:yes gene_type:complete
MAAIQGLRGTGQFTNDFRPKNYREMFTLLEPNGSAPLNALLSMTSSEGTDDPEYKNFRDELPDRKLSVNGAVASASTTAITVDAGNDNLFAVAGTIIVNSETGEVMRCTADSTATGLTVERNIGGTSHTIADGAMLFIAGSAYEEGASSPTGVSFDASVATNFTQIFRTSFQVTETLNATNLRTGDKEDEMATKALKMHMSDIERAMFFGKKHESNGSTSQPRRFTGGLTTTLSNVIDRSTASSSMSEDQFDRFLIEDIFAFGSKQKLAFCGAKVAGHLQKIGKNRWSPTQIDDSYGINFTNYQTFAGDLMVHLHPQFRQVPGMDNAMIILDFPYLKYRYLDGRDTQLLRDRQAPDLDAKKHEYLTECGLELTQDKVHTYIKNWTTLT